MKNYHSTIVQFLATDLVLVLMFSCLGSSAVGQEYDGFLEPILKIDLSSDESGAIFQLMVDEGDSVSQGSPVAYLDSRSQEIQLEIATLAAQSESQILAASDHLQKRMAVNEKLNQLRDKGYASEAEVLRAELELSIAEARLKTAQEEADLRKLEQKRAEVQLNRRMVTAPFSGLVTKVHAREGEYISPMSPEIVSIVQVDRLLAKINVPLAAAQSLKAGQSWSVRLASGATVIATVQRVGIELNAESETIEIRLLIDNLEGNYKSGERVTISI